MINKPRLIKWSKRLVLIGAIFPILLFLAFAGAVSYIDFNRYKPQIEAEVKQRTGHDFRIEGSIEMSVFPFAFTIGQASLKNASVFAAESGEENLLSVKQVHAEISVWELFLHKRLSIMGVELIEPHLNLVQTEKGQSWQRLTTNHALVPAREVVPRLRHASADAKDLHAFLNVVQRVDTNGVADQAISSQAVQPKSSIEPENLAEQSDQRTNGWHFESLVIQDGTIRYDDRIWGHQSQVSKLNLLAFDVELGEPFQVRTDFAYRTSQVKRDYDFDLTAFLEVSPDFGFWQVSDWQGVFKLRLPESQEVPEMRLVTQGDKFSLNLFEDQVQVVDVQLKALGSEMITSFSGRYGVQADLYGVLIANGINVQNWGRHLGLNMPDFVNKEALTEVKGELGWELSGGRLNVSDIALTWDQSTLTGQLWRQSGPSPKYNFDFEIDRLNLDDYRARFVEGLPDGSGQSVRPEQKTEGQQEASTYLPLAVPISTLRHLEATGNVQIGKLTAWGISGDELEMALTAKQGVLELAPVDMKLYGGRVQSEFKVDVNGTTPAYFWHGTLEQVNTGALLQAGWEGRPLDGKLSARFDMATQGSNGQAIRHNLKGSLKAAVDQGHFYGVDIERLLAGKAIADQDKTPFKQLALEGEIRGGVAKLQPLTLESRRFEGRGSGQVDLNRTTLDVRLDLEVTEPIPSLSSLKGMKVPVRCQGDLKSPQWSVNLRGLLNQPGNREKLIKQFEGLFAG